ncbi:hypothetical protein B0F90DRAFT_1738042 [Multifurca ochricompacta]|uniref:Uncharacterized protein n=1 Tax=Multifurca ochricompacta TaxID=376703 RepID=A0AAD4M0B7_9AGAM|nr:hypothetical protein B0F90DRAFT_1738042 [Multifurca ochricompacta]
MNGAMTTTTTTTLVPPRTAKPPPTGPAPPPPSGSARQPHPAVVNGKSKKKVDPAPIDPAAMYESLKNRIAALEEEEVFVEEEERRYAEEAQKHVRGLEENAVHTKYIELFAEFKRMEREHQKEKQKLLKDKDAAKSQLTKANQTKVKMENLARELQKDNKRLREDGKRLSQSVEEAQDEIVQMKNDISRRAEKAKMQDLKFRQSPDIVVKVVCRYRAELFFKISRKTKLVKLFAAWTDRMETGSGGSGGGGGGKTTGEPNGTSKLVNGVTPAPSSTGSVSTGTNFIFTHSGRQVDAEQTPEEAGMEDGDEILAVELMDLTEGPSAEVLDESAPRLQKLKKYWSDDPAEAARTMEDIFDGVVRERLRDILRQYELRERHFECVIRSKELEVLLSRARAAEQKQLAEGEKARAEKLEEENQQNRKELDDAQKGQTVLVERLISCCKEPNAERTQRLFASLREELEKRGRAPITANRMEGSSSSVAINVAS